MSKEKKLLSNVYQLLRLERREIIAIYFYAISSGLIQLSLPLGIQAIIGFAMGATMVTSVYILIALIVIGVLLVGLLQINQMKIIEKIQQKIFVRYALDFAEKIPDLDLKEIDAIYLPEKLNHFFDIQNIQKGFAKLLLDIPVATIQIIFGLILLSFYHPFFIAFSLILVSLLILIFRLTAKPGLTTSIAESNSKYAVAAWFEEMGRVIKSFKYSQGTNLNLKKTDENLYDYVISRTSHFKVLLFQFRSLVFFKVCITALMLLLGTYLLFEQQINVGQFVAIEIVILAIINSMEKLIISLENVYDLITGLKKLHTIVDLGNEKNGNIEFESNELKIEINNLNFSYDDNIAVFNNFSLTILPNTITCISGAENSGKSTLLKLLTGIYRDFTGTIVFNNLPIQHYNLQSLRAKTGVILSEQDIFKGTLYENIVLGKSNIAINDIMLLAKKMNIQNIILDFPDSFDTILQPYGKKLPTTTIKKILLLRALVHDPLLLILEDPWGGLDNEHKASIQAYLLEAAKQKTIIITSNDIAFAKKCDLHVDTSSQNTNL